jgi:DnaK suppressor protein
MTAIKFPMKVLKPVRQYLKEHQDRLIERKKALEKEDPYNDTDAAEEVGHDRVSALKLEIDKTLVRIKKALTKIRVGKYGICDKCGKMIDTDRLAIDPTVVTCIKCVKKNK